MEKVKIQTAIRVYARAYFLLILLTLSVTGISQNVGINPTGAPPNAAAGLDVDFPDKGILIPRVSLTSTTSFAPLTAHVAGMVVYNTATINDVVPGFYFNNGTAWIPAFLPGKAIGDMLYWDGAKWQMIPIGLSGQILQISASNIPAWGGGAFATLTTNAATSITATTAVTGGNITADGGAAVLTRGVCYAQTPSPTTANSIVTAVPAAGIGTFTSNLTGLTRAKTYYVRAYATNNSVTSYGNEQTFTTLPLAPTLAATTAATSVTANTAVSGGNVTDDGGSPIIERGICYGTTTNPTTANSKVIDPANTTGTFISNISGLATGTAYYVRAYAINSVGTSYGTQITFTTLPTVSSTTAASAITATTATSGGVIAPFGTSYTVYTYGLAYSTTSNAPTPTRIAAGSYPPVAGVTFTTNLTGLSGNTLYYIRAYAQIPSGVYVYGPELSFTTTAPSAPVIASTTAITAITSVGANSGGSITSDGGSPITAKGVCWSTSPAPVLGTGNFTSNGTGTTAYSSIMSGLTQLTTYYVRAYATNAIGTGYGPTDIVFTTCGTPIYTVGQAAGGGIVFYVDCTGQHGLIAASVDQGSAAWGCSGTTFNTPTTVGSGAANTAAILAGCATRPIAASLASSYAGGGFTDWYLPSSGELALMMSQYAILGLGNGVTYQSSTDGGSTTVATCMYQNAGNIQTTAAVKTYAVTVRAIRSF